MRTNLLLYSVLCFALGWTHNLQGQTESIPLGLEAQIAAVRKLQPPLRVLYVAAHPDDENTRLIAWLSQGRSVETAYLSLTRGDGGQNLIGPQLGPELGVIRTDELMAARSIDGGLQYFTRAVDFGYSKNPEESLEHWGKDSVLSDVVWVIRHFRPDYIVTRFPTDGRGGHGHHTASALLAEEAFDLAGDPSAYPGQLRWVKPHQSKAVYWNNSPWWDKTLADQSKANPVQVVEVEVGDYDIVSGTSCNELASLSRSMHKSQGFGIPMARGEMKEYLIFRKGQPGIHAIAEGQDPRLLGHPGLSGLENFIRTGQTEAALQGLFALRSQIPQESAHRIDLLAAGLCGVYAGLRSEVKEVVQNEEISLYPELMIRAQTDVQLVSVEVLGKRDLYNKSLKYNVLWSDTARREARAPLSSPSWLEDNDGRLYHRSQALRAIPVDSASVEAVFHLRWGVEVFSVRAAAEYRWTDRVQGELKQPLSVVPPATIAFDRQWVYSSGTPVNTVISVQCHSGQFHGNLGFEVPEGWTVQPKFIPIDAGYAGEIQQYTLSLIPPVQARNGLSQGVLRPYWDPSGSPVRGFSEIDYAHIPHRTLFVPTQLPVRAFALEVCTGTIGYIEGAGDEVASVLSELGFRVEVLDETTLLEGNLNRYTAIVAGIRAYNTREVLVQAEPRLLEYVRQGGTYVVQYNTNGSDLKLPKLGPEASIAIGRERVSVETAPVRFVDPEHPLLLEPNRIGPADFEGWAQERGLYFASDWDAQSQPLLSWSDPNEPARLGGLIVRPYGKGIYVYTGISFFRQLPSGVPGACRLMANLLCGEL
ncbi:hypothetical protein GC167_09565 [bacterium]|nr:hypothetical protein [bacterium]